jgi:hypothetical protein
MWIWLSCVSPRVEPLPLEAPARSPRSQKAVDVGGERMVIWSAGDVSVLDDTIVPEDVAVSGDGRTLVVRDLGSDMRSRLWVSRDGGPLQLAAEPRGFLAAPAFLGRFGDSDLFVTAWADVLLRETRPQWGLYLLSVSEAGARLEPWETGGEYVSYLAVDPSGTRLATVRGSIEPDEGDVILVRPLVSGARPSLGQAVPILRDPPPELAVRGLVFYDREALAYNWAPTVIGDELQWHASTLPTSPGSVPSELPDAGWVIASQPTSPPFLAGTHGVAGDTSGDMVRYDTGEPLLSCAPHQCVLLAFSPQERVLYATLASPEVPFRYPGLLRIGW